MVYFRLRKNAKPEKNHRYLPAGAESEFSFEEVAFYFTSEKVPPEKIPEKIEIQVESFDTVQSP